ncbi:hypothetical protein ACFL02_07300, partial [Planctomycetota bacterium]
AEKPKMNLTPEMKKLSGMALINPQLANVLNSLLGVPPETQKGGASHEISSNGVWSFSDPKEATPELGQKTTEHMTNLAINFINAWKKASEETTKTDEEPVIKENIKRNS